MSERDARAAGRGIILVVAGPSGVGKGTMISGLRKRHPSVQWSVSCTTRPPRPGEVDGRDYYFVTPAEFERMKAAGELLEWAIVHGTHVYGTPRAPVEEALAAGNDIVLEIDYQGARSIRKALPEAVLVFVAPPSVRALISRLEGRNTEDDQTVLQRLRSARTEFQHIGMFHFLIVNDDLDAAIEALDAVYLAERQRLHRADWQGLQARLLTEMEEWLP